MIIYLHDIDRSDNFNFKTVKQIYKRVKVKLLYF